MQLLKCQLLLNPASCRVISIDFAGGAYSLGKSAAFSASGGLDKGASKQG